MQCAECLAEVSEPITCDVCGKRVCERCFREWHDGNTLPLELIEDFKRSTV